jgi:hypothetical protein
VGRSIENTDGVFNRIVPQSSWSCESITPGSGVLSCPPVHVLFTDERVRLRFRGMRKFVLYFSLTPCSLLVRRWRSTGVSVAAPLAAFR